MLFVLGHRKRVHMRLLISSLQGIDNALFNGQLVLARLVFLGSKQSRRVTNNESCDKESASTRVYAAHFVLQKCPKSLKENLEKKKTVVFRKRISAKTTIFFGL